MTVELNTQPPTTASQNEEEIAISEQSVPSEANPSSTVLVIPRTMLNYVVIAAVCLFVGAIIGMTITSRVSSSLSPEMISTVVAKVMKEDGPVMVASPAPAPIVNASVDDDPSWGPPDAPVTIIEFSDFQCPFCGRFHQDTYDQIRSNYDGKIRFVYRDYPIVQLHPFAEISAEAAECVNEQGKFWEFHDLLLKNQTITSADDVHTLASQLGLSMANYNDCMSTRRYQQEVAKDIQDGNSYGVSGTPTFFINGQPLVGAQPYAVFAAVIDAQLAKVSEGESTVAPSS